MMEEALTVDEILDRISGLQENVEDLPLGEVIRREAEGFGFYMQEFWNRVNPTDADDFIDHVEAAMVRHGHLVDLDVDHRFLKGMTIRRCYIPAGLLTVSKIHDTEHSLSIMQGVMTIWTKEDGIATYGAPNILVTKPGTRRLIFTHLDSHFVTHHPGNDVSGEALVERIIKKRDNRLVGGSLDEAIKLRKKSLAS